MERVLKSIAELSLSFPALRNEACVVAFSGGKDSLTLAHALRVMGAKVQLVSIDMGYSNDWADRIKAVAERLAFDCRVISVAELLENGELPWPARLELSRRREALDALGDSRHGPTPCTHCYGCKILSLTEAPFPGKDKQIYFGHHSTDMVSSFLKSCMMYFDRFELNEPVFDKHRYRSLADYIASDLSTSSSKFIAVFLGYLHANVASTQEPPVEIKQIYGSSYTIFRPMLLIDEGTTKEYAAQLGVDVEASGCGHTFAKASRTPREIVQLEILPKILARPAGRANIRLIQKELVAYLNANGTLRYDARENRNLLMGAEYKKEFEVSSIISLAS